ncbi:MAG: aldo/keto reductase [Lachnospiraceae bacterium]|nr:aldo/keto reductase [Lachnospiraceae bacterium]
MELFKGYRFGFGCMRLPVKNPDDQTSFDYETIEAMFDRFLELGGRYFDTAYTYHGYHGEEAVRKALVERHPRESFELVTKMPLRDFKDEEDLQTVFNEQLSHCGVEYFDYYLLHNMGHNVYAKCEQYHAFAFVRRMQQEGKIKAVGMSFHDTPELLEEILSKYGDCIDFLQLQVNYLDMDQPNVQARRCLEVARKYQKPVSVMEPCKGGTLINVPEEAKDLIKAFDPAMTPASLALRFAASQEGVFRVLSGMGTVEQVEENCAAFDNFKPLLEEEYKLIEEVKSIILKNTAIPCTGCAYCTHECPQQIAIPQYFALYNSMKQKTGSFSSQAVYYNNTVLAGHGKASSCVHCGLCEDNCPQHLPIRAYLVSVSEIFDQGPGFPTRK